MDGHSLNLKKALVLNQNMIPHHYMSPLTAGTWEGSNGHFVLESNWIVTVVYVNAASTILPLQNVKGGGGVKKIN